MSVIDTDYPGLRDLCATEGPGTKQYFTGTHRVVAPEATVARWRPHLATFGITRLADVTDLDVIGIPVVQAIRPNARTLSVAQGKGATRAAAEASALMEGAEFWHAEHHQLSLRRASWAALRGEGTLGLDRLPRRAGATLDPHHPILWALGRELVRGDQVWVPEALVGMDHTPPRDALGDCFLMTSGGLASGNQRLEATAHALYELVERDAWALSRARSERGEPTAFLDLESIDDPTTRSLVERCRTAGVRVVAWDISSDLGVPCIAATVFDDPPNPFRRLPATSGMGCHPSATVALSRAVTEAVQSRLTIIAGSRDDMEADLYTGGRISPQAEAMRRWLVEAIPTRRFDELPERAAASVVDDVAWTLDRLCGRGLDQVVVVDLTIPSIGMAVVRVLVPGLEDRSDRWGFDKFGDRAQAVSS